MDSLRHRGNNRSVSCVDDAADIRILRESRLQSVRPRSLNGKGAAILAQKAEQQVDGSVRHIGNDFHHGSEAVIPAEEFRFARQVFLNRPAHARVEKLRVRRSVEETIEARRVVLDLDVAINGGFSFNRRQQTPGVEVEGRTINHPRPSWHEAGTGFGEIIHGSLFPRGRVT